MILRQAAAAWLVAGLLVACAASDQPSSDATATNEANSPVADEITTSAPSDSDPAPSDSDPAPSDSDPAPSDSDPASGGAEDSDEPIGEPDVPLVDTVAPRDSATTAPTITEPDLASPDPAACVDALTTRERAALVVWPAVDAVDWAGASDNVRTNDVGGVLLMSQAGLTGEQVAQRLADLEAASRHGLIIATDEEGGDVQRLRDVSELASQRIVARDLGIDAATSLISQHGAVVRSLGVDMVFGPVVDVEPPAAEVPLTPSRFFAGPPETVSAFGGAYLRGWHQAGLFATLKHYPGHGAASGDTHITAGVTPSFEDLEGFDLKPYSDLSELARAPETAVMIGHLTVPGLTDGVPATRSAAAIDYLRDALGYGDTLLITDALGMAAVGIPEPEASVLALEAGIDIVIFTLSSQTDEVIDAITAATESGRIDPAQLDAAARKGIRMLARDGHTCDSGR